MSKYRFETLQLHVGQEHPDPQLIQERYRFIRQHLMFSETLSMRQTDLALQMPVTSMEDLRIPHRMCLRRE